MSPIIFFDGYCNLCNAAVNWIIKKDKKHVFKFASLQGATAKKHIPTEMQQFDSIILFINDKFYTHLQAVGIICKHLGFPYKLGVIFYTLPKFLYNFIAKNRYRWFGKKETCRLPTAAEKMQFLP